MGGTYIQRLMKRAIQNLGKPGRRRRVKGFLEKLKNSCKILQCDWSFEQFKTLKFGTLLAIFYGHLTLNAGLWT